MDTNCTHLEDWLVEQPDAGALPAEWEPHLAACPTCAQRWQDERRLAAAIVVWRANPPRPPATSALVSTLLAEVAVKHNTLRSTSAVSRRRSWWPMVAASAALVIVGIGLTRLTSTDTATPWTAATTTSDATQQLALTSTVGTLMSQFEGTSFDVLTASQNALPRFPAFQQNQTSPFEAGEIIDPAAPSAVLRYGQPLGQSVGEAFRFLQIAVSIPSTDAG